MIILDNDLYDSIVSWTPDGLAFTIHDQKAFEEQVIPIHFAKSAKFRSFLRKVSFPSPAMVLLSIAPVTPILSRKITLLLVSAG